MTIVEAIKSGTGVRVSYGDKWLIHIIRDYEVYQRKFGAKKTIKLISTQNEEEAVAVLLQDSIWK